MFASNGNAKKVFVGLSGGVDSAVSAALLKRQGYDVTGAFIRIQIPGMPCPAAEDRLEAMRVAAHLGIPFREVDLSQAYEKKVFNDMLASYKRGETPNPDALCNREIKFGLFYDWCVGESAEYVATGHYARIAEEEGEFRLYAGADAEKDQSYFLWDIPAERLRSALFPLGALHKTQVRALAKTFGLPNASRKDSQGLCFLGAVSLEEVLEQRLRPKAGEVLDRKGNVIGRHRGAALYTLGQRHGFAIYAHSPAMPPHFVVAKDIQKNTITVSKEKKPLKSRARFALRKVNWLGTAPAGPCEARFCYRQPLIPAVLQEEKRSVLCPAPRLAASGQSAVLYRDGRCLGGGILK